MIMIKAKITKCKMLISQTMKITKMNKKIKTYLDVSFQFMNKSILRDLCLFLRLRVQTKEVKDCLRRK